MTSDVTLRDCLLLHTILREKAFKDRHKSHTKLTLTRIWQVHRHCHHTYMWADQTRKVELESAHWMEKIMLSHRAVVGMKGSACQWL